MAKNTANINISLESSSKVAEFPSSAGKLLESLIAEQKSSDISEESYEAFTSPGNTEIYKRLQSKGLNNLRSEIISICEFIPISTENIDESASMHNKKLGENNSISVSNISRVIELHRQIREYIYTASQLVLDAEYPGLSDPEFLKELSRCVNRGFNASADTSTKKTVDNIITAILNNEVNKVGPASNKTVELIATNRNNPYFLGLVEYFVYRRLVDEISKYLYRMSEIENNLSGYVNIDNFRNLKTFNPASAFENVDDRAKNSFNSETQTLLYDDNLSLSLMALDTLTDNVSGDIYINAIGQLINVCTFRDSARTLSSLSSADRSLTRVQTGKMRIGIQSDLSETIANIKSIPLKGFLTLLGDNTQEEINSFGVNYEPEKELTLEKFYSYFKNIRNASGEGFDEVEEGSKELMAALSYDIMSWYITRIGGEEMGTSSSLSEGSVVSDSTDLGYSIADSLHSFRDSESRSGVTNNNNNQYVRYSKELAKEGNNIYFDYLQKNFGINKNILDINEAESGSKIIDISESLVSTPGNTSISNEPNKVGFGDFTRNTYGYRKGTFYSESQNNSVNYLPLESSNTTDNAIPGTKFFVESKLQDLALSSNSQENSEYSKFVKDYKKLSNYLFEDILTLYPHSELTKQYNSQENEDNRGKGEHRLTPLGLGSAKTILFNMIQGLILDLEDVISQSNDEKTSLIPLLAIILKASNDETEESIFPFLSSLWGEVYLDPVDESNTKIKIGRYLEYYTEMCAINFFKSLGLSPRDAGSEATREFEGGSGQSYNLWLGDNNDLFYKENIADKFNSGKDLNKKIENDSKTGSTTVLEIKAKKIDNVFDNTLGGGNRLSKVSEGKESNNVRYGIHRLFSKLYEAANNLEIHESLNGKTNMSWVDPEFNDTNSGKRNYIDHTSARMLENGRGYPDEDLVNPNGVNGELINFSGQHAILIAYQWATKLIQKTIQVFAQTTSDGTFSLKIYDDQILGTIDGLKSVMIDNSGSSSNITGSDINSDISGNFLERLSATIDSFNSNSDISGNFSENYINSYQIAKNYAEDTVSKITIRENFIRDIAGLFSAHSDAIKGLDSKIDNIFEGDAGSLAVNVLKENNVFKDSVIAIDSLGVGELIKSKNKFFELAKDSLIFRNTRHVLPKINLMEKVFSRSGYGFLKSEKLGQKSMINVGIPKTMISTLQSLAFRETSDPRYIDSPFVCISVFKKNHLDPEAEYYPKNFIFDVSANILDYKIGNSDLGKLTNHLENLKTDMSFSNILKSIELQRFLPGGQNIKIHTSFGYGETGMFSKEVLINHLHDYLLKEYIKMTTGFLIDESSFLLTEKPINYQNVETTQNLGTRLNNEYRRVLENIKKRYPKIEVDDQLKSEVFRMISMIKQSAPFSFVNRFKQTIIPNSFDKVYTVLINEKDFVRIPPEGTPDNHILSIDGSLTRKIVSSYQISEDGSLSYGNTINVLNESDNNTPSVYNYYTQVSILPIGFVEGAQPVTIDGGTTSSISFASPIQSTGPVTVPVGLF